MVSFGQATDKQAKIPSAKLVHGYMVASPISSNHDGEDPEALVSHRF